MASVFCPRSQVRTLITPDKLENIADVHHGAFDTSLSVIAILVCVGEEGVQALNGSWLIDGPKDSDLPVRYDDNDGIFATISPGKKRTFKPFSDDRCEITNFETWQWRFVAPTFRIARKDLEFIKIDYDCPLPFIWRGSRSKDRSDYSGSYGDVDKIKIHRSHLEPQKVRVPSRAMRS